MKPHTQSAWTQVCHCVNPGFSDPHPGGFPSCLLCCSGGWGGGGLRGARGSVGMKATLKTWEVHSRESIDFLGVSSDTGSPGPPAPHLGSLFPLCPLEGTELWSESLGTLLPSCPSAPQVGGMELLQLPPPLGALEIKPHPAVWR